MQSDVRQSSETLNRVDEAMAHSPHRRVILEMDSSESTENGRICSEAVPKGDRLSRRSCPQRRLR